jgi:hypothetical protein
MRVVHWLAVFFLTLLVACSQRQGATAASSPAATTAAPAPAASNEAPGSSTREAAQEVPVRTQAAAAETYPVRWWSGLGLKNSADAAALYAAPAPDAFGELQRGDVTHRPNDCREWTKLHAEGYKPTTTVEAQADSGAELRCMTLLLLQRARPAKTSYIRDLVWNSSLLSVLPASVATTFNAEREQAVAKAVSEGLALSRFDPKARGKTSDDEHTLEIIEGNGQTMIIVHAEAWGDFNGDGVDDVALSVVNGATRGTYSYVRLLTLSRDSRDAMLKPIVAK